MVTIFKQFQEFFQPHDGVKCLKALEMLEMHFKREISNLSCFQADAPFSDAGFSQVLAGAAATLMRLVSQSKSLHLIWP
jgi:hypothetical protein